MMRGPIIQAGAAKPIGHVGVQLTTTHDELVRKTATGAMGMRAEYVPVDEERRRFIATYAITDTDRIRDIERCKVRGAQMLVVGRSGFKQESQSTLFENLVSPLLLGAYYYLTAAGVNPARGNDASLRTSMTEGDIDCLVRKTGRMLGVPVLSFVNDELMVHVEPKTELTTPVVVTDGTDYSLRTMDFSSMVLSVPGGNWAFHDLAAAVCKGVPVFLLDDRRIPTFRDASKKALDNHNTVLIDEYQKILVALHREHGIRYDETQFNALIEQDPGAYPYTYEIIKHAHSLDYKNVRPWDVWQNLRPLKSEDPAWDLAQEMLRKIKKDPAVKLEDAIRDTSLETRAEAFRSAKMHVTLDGMGRDVEGGRGLGVAAGSLARRSLEELSRRGISRQNIGLVTGYQPGGVHKAGQDLGAEGFPALLVAEERRRGDLAQAENFLPPVMWTENGDPVVEARTALGEGQGFSSDALVVVVGDEQSIPKINAAVSMGIPVILLKVEDRARTLTVGGEGTDKDTRRMLDRVFHLDQWGQTDYSVKRLDLWVSEAERKKYEPILADRIHQIAMDRDVVKELRIVMPKYAANAANFILKLMPLKSIIDDKLAGAALDKALRNKLTELKNAVQRVLDMQVKATTVEHNPDIHVVDRPELVADLLAEIYLKKYGTSAVDGA